MPDTFQFNDEAAEILSRPAVNDDEQLEDLRDLAEALRNPS